MNKRQRKSSRTWKHFLYLKFRPHAELNMYVFFCLLVFFFSFREQHEYTEYSSYPWHNLALSYRRIFYLSASTSLSSTFSLRGAWRLKGAGGSLWAPPPEEHGLPALQASPYARFTRILFQSIILSPCSTLVLFACVPCLLPASLLFFNETAMCCNLRVRHWSETQLNYYSRNYLNKKSVFTLCWRWFGCFLLQLLLKIHKILS